MVLKSNVKLILLTCIIVPSLIIGLTFVFPYEYKSSASLLPQQESSSGGLSGFISSLSGLGASMGLDALGGKQSSQSRVFADILVSRSNITYVIDKLRLDTIPMYKKLDKDELVEFFRDNLDVKLEKSGLLMVTTSVKTRFFPNKKDERYAAELAAKISNACLEGLDYNVRTKSTSTAKKTKGYLEGEIVKYKNRLDSLNSVYQEFQSKNKIIDLEEQGKAIVLQAIEVGTELSKAQSELDIALFQQSPSSEYVKTLSKQVESLKEQYTKIQRGGLTGNDDFSISINKIPELAREYSAIYRDKKILEQVIIYLETQKFQEAIQSEKDLPVIEPLDVATAPIKRTSPNRLVILMLSIFVSFVVSLVYIITSSSMKGKKLDNVNA